MPTSYKILGQSAPNASTTATLYTCPSSPSTQTIISSIVVCNRSSSDTNFRVSVRPSTEALANKHYLCFNTNLYSFDTITMTLGITVDSGSIVEVWAGSANVSFSCFGSEVS